MTYFHIHDQTRSLHLVVSAHEGTSGSVVCTTTDFCDAQDITKLLNQQRAAVAARCEAEAAATSDRPVCPSNTVIRSGVIPPPPPPPALKKSLPEPPELDRGDR